MKLRHETNQQFLEFCRQAIIAQRQFLDSLRHNLDAHRYENHTDPCDFCDLLLEVIMTNEQILDIFNKRYNDTVRGVNYE